jgi:hypothetical protein
MPVIIKINHDGVKALLRSEGVQAELRRRAEQIAAAANAASGLDAGFVVDNDVGKNRARSVVVTATADAMVAEATDRTLTRSFDAGRA